MPVPEETHAASSTPSAPQRIVVGGISGAGKTTLARCLANRLGYVHIELDALYHGPDWTVRSSYMGDLLAIFASHDRWVVDSIGYVGSREAIFSQADTLIWLDPPRWRVLVRVFRRSLARVVLRRTLYNGNRERLADLFSKEHPLRWSMANYKQRQRDIASLIEGAGPSLRVIRVSSSVSCAGLVGIEFNK